MFDQSGAHRMVANVSGLFIEALIIAQSMIKEVALPIHGEMASSVTFPASNRFLHSHFRSESSEQVQVIRHEDEQSACLYAAQATTAAAKAKLAI